MGAIPDDALVPIRVIPLRERREDIALLLMHFLAKFKRLRGRLLTGFTQRAVDAVMSYDWPGSIRELENVVEHGVIPAANNTVIDTPQLFTSGEQFGDKQFTPPRAAQAKRLLRSRPFSRRCVSLAGSRRPCSRSEPRA
jgi:two-component system, NtrC family, response regulator HydG